ncbi:MAG: hypothetical protein Q7K34_02930 [archaeon]|nr:hypothetical protein [archaeon]
MKIAFFDLETKYLFEDLDGGYSTMSSLDKKKRVDVLIPQIGLATACIITDSSKPETFVFDEGKEKELIEALNGYERIVGHNVLNFDYRVLSGQFNGDIVAHYTPKTLDTFEELKKATIGQWIGLDDLAQQNLGKNKTEDSKKIPSMWRAGKKPEVRAYCKNDVQLLKDVYYYGKEHGKLKYTKKDYGRVIGIEEVKTPWL